MSTMDNLKEAFAGESQANRKYLAFAKKALEDGRPQIAKLFRATAGAETIHAHGHLRVMGGVKSTLENLQAAAEGENYEFTQMYPKFVAEAEKEGDKAAIMTLSSAMKVEQIHHGLFTQAIEAAKAGNDLPATPIYICTICGNTVTGSAPDKCPICGAGKDKFSQVK